MTQAISIISISSYSLLCNLWCPLALVCFAVFIRAQLLFLDERDEDVGLAQSAQDADPRLEVLYLSVIHVLYGGDGNISLVC